MDIKNLTTNVAASRNNDSVKQPIKELDQNSTQSTGMPTDKVTLTGVLSQVMDLEIQSKNVNIDNSDRVAALKAAVQDGSYQVNTQKIAEKLIQTEALFAKA
ncbi:MAG: flagellar biosynthesis anti-sigma factor FlgM [Thiomicrorhabdus sp.]|nr:flagellar biosynthesis anti-sigma factor FlgM [Thiomicrorhabdus sp.]